MDTKNGYNSVTPLSQTNPSATNPIQILYSISIPCRYHQPGARYFPSRVRVRVQTGKDPPRSYPIGTAVPLFRFPLFCFVFHVSAKCGSPPAAARPRFPTSRVPHGMMIIAVESTSQGPGKWRPRVVAQIGALGGINSGTALGWCDNCRFCFPQRGHSCFWVEPISRMRSDDGVFPGSAVRRIWRLKCKDQAARLGGPGSF
ncbi:hypothetical protein QBC34DRAFT_83900 [Podospora aff. communis PSN243]|uniref:Uncharacterized protein n=1 Tax=Podospora aff. communis PSN243 TaxID=3040156 RepID=A0AAV9GNF8_9PEZI|nr:hypothetical protein QBC34DRAFT_83900 [Podospora aff. communis PSN243]